MCCVIGQQFNCRTGGGTDSGRLGGVCELSGTQITSSSDFLQQCHLVLVLKMALAVSWRGSALASKRRRTIKWWCVHRAATAATLSVLALAALATETSDISPAETQATATSLLEAARESNSNSNSNRPFFIQDPTDGLCLSGGTFKRCAVDTLWKVEGEPGRHSVRRLAVLDDGELTTASTPSPSKACRSDVELKDVSFLLPSKVLVALNDQGFCYKLNAPSPSC